MEMGGWGGRGVFRIFFGKERLCVAMGWLVCMALDEDTERLCITE